ncbi:MAG: hypothetical protein ABFD79_18530 [Phycisphaerales bacterium]
MKKLIAPAITVSITLFVSYFVFAQGQRIPHDINAVELPPGVGCVGDNTLAGRLADYCPIRYAMAQNEFHNQVITNTDGGIIVLAGSQLLKYDKDLNLLRKIDLDIDINDKLKSVRQNDIKISELVRFYWW